MARQTMTVQQISRSGLTPSYDAAHVDGHAFENDGLRTFLHIKNDGVGATIATITTPKTVDDLAVADRTVTIALGAEKMIGPFPVNTYNQDDNTVYVDFDTLTSVTLAAIKL